MSFTSFQFVLFFGVIYLVNWGYRGITRKKETDIKSYKTLLLVESYLFILLSDVGTLISLLLLTLVCYLAAKGIKRYSDKQKFAKTFLIFGLIIALGQLCMFKYYGFFAESICKALSLPYSSKVYYAPLGISFFTFSVVGYLVDIYKKKYNVEDSLFDLSLYLAYFPKFLSGPIVRPDKFQVQLQEAAKETNLNNLQIGIQYVIWGMFKKMVLADHLSIFVDDVFFTPTSFHSITCIWAMVSYSLQIYFDFSGYSDMAIGFSKMLGIHIEKNFDLPYISRNVTEFWKRWHISLSSWLQDYVYISLGGNRKGKMRTRINLILTMLLGGLWHGAAWTFVIWGGIHGLALVIHKKFKAVNKSEPSKMKVAISVLFTFIYVTITWVFFRASSLQNAFTMLLQAILFQDGIMQIYTWTWLAILFAVCEVLLAKISQYETRDNRTTVVYPIMELTTVKNLMLFFILIGLTIILAYVGNTAFIYGKF